jgi:methylmalonyl-CoA/ethylmalonyl-CoA epimerase
MPSGPLAHVCFLVKDLDKAIEDWTKILGVLDPAQLEAPIVRYDRFEAGGDIMSWANFVNPNGCEIQLLCPLNEDGPLGKRLAKRGEGVHHICFTTPDLEGSVDRLAEAGVELTSRDLSQDPQVPWQWWTFVSPATSHGLLVEVAYPYEAVDGKWEPGEGVPVPAGDDDR